MSNDSTKETLGAKKPSTRSLYYYKLNSCEEAKWLDLLDWMEGKSYNISISLLCSPASGRASAVPPHDDDNDLS